MLCVPTLDLRGRMKSMIVMMLLLASLGAHEANEFLEDETLNDSLKVGRLHIDRSARHDSDLNESVQFHANMRLSYITKKESLKQAMQADALGGHIGFERSLFSHKLSMGLLFYASQAVALDAPVNSDLLGGKEHAGFIGEAYVKYHHHKQTLKLGRISLDSVRVDSDDIRHIPNLFEGLHYENRMFDGIHIEAALITAMAGWENGADIDEFVSVYDSFGVADAWANSINGALSMLHTGYENETFSLQLFDYTLFNALNMFYIEANSHYDIDAFFTLSYALQWGWDKGLNTFSLDKGTRLVHDYEAQVLGGFVALQEQRSALKLIYAYNEGLGRYAPLRSLGGGSYFTSMEDSTYDTVIASAKGVAQVVALEHNAAHFVDGLTWAYYLGDFKNGLGVDTLEQDLIVSYEGSRFMLTLALADVWDRSVAQASFKQFRCVLDMPIKE